LDFAYDRYPSPKKSMARICLFPEFAVAWDYDLNEKIWE
jgi:hypothetical protein